MKIVFDADTLGQGRPRGSVTGVVYFDFGAGRQFPCAGWNDFVVVLSNWWSAAFDELVHGQASAELLFMDGPHAVTAIGQGRARLLLRCKNGRDDAAPFEVTVGLGDLGRELARFAEDVSRACASAGIESDDLDDLRRRLPH